MSVANPSHTSRTPVLETTRTDHMSTGLHGSELEEHDPAELAK